MKLKEKNKWLIHIKTEIVEPDLAFDIAKHKIYYDSVEGNFRRKLQCECGADLGCFCFGSLEGALESIDCDLVICDRCYLKDPDTQEADLIQTAMQGVCPNKTVDQMNDIDIKVIMNFCREQSCHDYNEIDMGVCGV